MKGPNSWRGSDKDVGEEGILIKGGSDNMLICIKPFFFTWKMHSEYTKSKNKNTLVSGNASDEKNLHPGGHKFIF